MNVSNCNRHSELELTDVFITFLNFRYNKGLYANPSSVITLQTYFFIVFNHIDLHTVYMKCG